VARVAVLVDLGFFLPRYRLLIEKHAQPPHSPRKVAAALWQTARRHINRKAGDELYRILVYDCKPLEKKTHHPISHRAVDFKKTDLCRFRLALHRELVCLRKVALRLGELHDGGQWLLKAEPTRRLLRGEISIDQLRECDVAYDTAQKGVDIKFGIDVASLAYRHLSIVWFSSQVTQTLFPQPNWLVARAWTSCWIRCGIRFRRVCMSILTV
jgi:uncharacterized LabA/DUF88 family protein